MRCAPSELLLAYPRRTSAWRASGGNEADRYEGEVCTLKLKGLEVASVAMASARMCGSGGRLNRKVEWRRASPLASSRAACLTTLNSFRRNSYLDSIMSLDLESSYSYGQLAIGMRWGDMLHFELSSMARWKDPSDPRPQPTISQLKAEWVRFGTRKKKRFRFTALPPELQLRVIEMLSYSDLKVIE